MRSGSRSWLLLMALLVALLLLAGGSTVEGKKKRHAKNFAYLRKPRAQIKRDMAQGLTVI